MSNLNIKVIYTTQTFIYNGSRNDFLKEVCNKYNLKKDEIQIFDTRKKEMINVVQLKNFDVVEIKKRDLYTKNIRSHIPDLSSSEMPDFEELTRKLLDNSALTGLERSHIIKILEDIDNPILKRRRLDSDQPVMKNREVQVDVNSVATRSYSTQTDELINNQPPINSTQSIDLQPQIKKLAASETVDVAIATDLMAKSFDMRRNFILKERPAVAFVKERYPLLFSSSEMRNEMDRIFYDGKCAEFLVNIEKYSEHVLFLLPSTNPLFQITKERMNEFETTVQKKYAQDVGALLLLSHLVSEKRNYLKVTDRDFNPKNFPFITCQAEENDLFSDNHLLKIVVEGIVVCETYDFKEAILLLVSSYFVFNIKYPVWNYNTLVSFEKLYLEASETNVSEIHDDVQQIYRCVQLRWQYKDQLFC